MTHNALFEPSALGSTRRRGFALVCFCFLACAFDVVFDVVCLFCASNALIVRLSVCLSVSLVGSPRRLCTRGCFVFKRWGVQSVCLFVCCKDPEYIGVSKNRLQGEEYGPVPQSTHGVPPYYLLSTPFSTACTAQRRRVPTEYPLGPLPAVPCKALPEEDLPSLPRRSLPSFLPSQLHPAAAPAVCVPRRAARWGTHAPRRLAGVLTHPPGTSTCATSSCRRSSRGGPTWSSRHRSSNNDNNNDRNARIAALQSSAAA